MGFIRRLINIGIIFLILILIGSLVYQKVENLSIVDSIYFTVITVTTIGYGDIAPKTTLGNIHNIFCHGWNFSCFLHHFPNYAVHIQV